MAAIIQFPQRESNSYRNLTRLIDLADNTAALGFYAEALVVGIEEGNFLPGEQEKLTEQIRSKRLDLTRPETRPAVKADKPGLYLYCPEMGESRPDCQIVARRSYYGKHFHISTPLSLKGRGITFDGVKEEKNLTASGKFMAGWNEYTVTERAFEKLQEKYSISQESLLD
mgnify:FL=1